MIQTSRLVLREARPSDLDELHGLFSQEETMKYWSNAPHTTISQSKTWLDSMIESPYNGVRDFVIELRTTSASQELACPAVSMPASSSNSTPPIEIQSSLPGAIGKVGCWNGSEVGLILSTTYWGKGYASEALEAVLEHIFNTISVDAGPGANLGSSLVSNHLTLKADVDPRNERCLKLMGKFGFLEHGRAEKTFETHLGWCDSVYLHLTHERWVSWRGKTTNMGH